jgi:hypothetical protein
MTEISNESKNSLARGSVLNFLNNSLQETSFMPDIILMIFFCMVNAFLPSVEFPHKITQYDDRIEIAK